MTLLLLTNFEIKLFYQNEPKFQSVYSRNNLPKVKDRAYVIVIDEYKSVRSHWITLYVNDNYIVCVDSFGADVPK